MTTKEQLLFRLEQAQLLNTSVTLNVLLKDIHTHITGGEDTTKIEILHPISFRWEETREYEGKLNLTNKEYNQLKTGNSIEWLYTQFDFENNVCDPDLWEYKTKVSNIIDVIDWDDLP